MAGRHHPVGDGRMSGIETAARRSGELRRPSSTRGLGGAGKPPGRSFKGRWGRCFEPRRTEAKRVIARPIPPPRLEEKHPAPVRQNLVRRCQFQTSWGDSSSWGSASESHLPAFMLVLSVFLVFIGLPLFFFGLAVMEVGLVGRL